MLRVYRKGAGLLDQIVARAHREAGLRRDVTALDIAWLIEQFSRRTPDAVDPREESRVRARIVAIAVDGLRTTGARPLPGPPPSRTRYEGRWRHGQADHVELAPDVVQPGGSPRPKRRRRG